MLISPVSTWPILLTWRTKRLPSEFPTTTTLTCMYRKRTPALYAERESTTLQTRTVTAWLTGMRTNQPCTPAEDRTVTISSGQDGPGLVCDKALSWAKRKCMFWLSCFRPRLQQNEATTAEALTLVRGRNREVIAMNRRKRDIDYSTIPRVGSTTGCSYQVVEWIQPFTPKGRKGIAGSPGT